MNPVKLDEELMKLIGDKPTVLPNLVLSRIDSTLAALPEKRHTNRARNLALASSAAAILGLILLGSGFVYPAMASVLKQIPGIESVFKFAGDFGLKTADEKGMTTNINQRVTDQGITVEVSEVMYDGIRLTVGYLQTSLNGIQELGDVEYEINGKPVHFPGGGSGSRLDEHTYAGVVELNPEEELPKHFQLKMTVFRIGSTLGKWEFSFPVEKITSDNKVILPMISKTYGNLSLIIKKIVFTPSSTEMDVEIKQPSKVNAYINFHMLDDKGMRLEPHGGSGGGRTEGDFEITTFKYQFGPVKDIPKTVTIRPVINGNQSSVLPKETRVLMEQSPNPEHPLVLSQGEIGLLKITQVEFLQNKTLVHYQTEGNDPHMQSNPLWIEDESGKKYLLLDKRTELVDPVLYKYVREFPVFRGDQKLTFVTKELPKPDYVKELEMTIPISP